MSFEGGDYPRLKLPNDDPEALLSMSPMQGCFSGHKITDVSRKMNSLYVEACCSVEVDPDALLQTAELNQALQDALCEAREELKALKDGNVIVPFELAKGVVLGYCQATYGCHECDHYVPGKECPADQELTPENIMPALRLIASAVK